MDTGLKGTYEALKSAVRTSGAHMSDIRYVIISHYHADHCGTLDNLLSDDEVRGITLLYTPWQEKYGKAKQYAGSHKSIEVVDGRKDLMALGIDGELIYTPGHTNDSCSLVIDNKVFAGDLIRLGEKDRWNGKAKKSWDILLGHNIETAYYGHGEPEDIVEGRAIIENNAKYALVGYMIKLIDKKVSVDGIVEKTGADREFVENVNRMYLTHQNVGVQGILDRIEIKGK